jgi:hypothetical protein
MIRKFILGQVGCVAGNKKAVENQRLGSGWGGWTRTSA